MEGDQFSYTIRGIAESTSSSFILLSAQAPRSPKYPSGSSPRHFRNANQRCLFVIRRLLEESLCGERQLLPCSYTEKERAAQVQEDLSAGVRPLVSSPPIEFLIFCFSSGRLQCSLTGSVANYDSFRQKLTRALSSAARSYASDQSSSKNIIIMSRQTKFLID
jgi:hypothetical protein